MPYPHRIDNAQLDEHALCYRTQGTKIAGDCASAAATDPTSPRSAPTPPTEPRDATPREDESTRNEALAHYDADPGIAVLLLAVMAFLFIVVTYQFLSDRLEDPVGRDKRVQIEVPKAPSQ